MYLCSRFTEYAIRFNMVDGKVLNIPIGELKISYESYD